MMYKIVNVDMNNIKIQEIKHLTCLPEAVDFYTSLT